MEIVWKLSDRNFYAGGSNLNIIDSVRNLLATPRAVHISQKNFRQAVGKITSYIWKAHKFIMQIFINNNR